MRFAIAGGTGTVGRHTTALAEAAGHEVVLLTRANGHDLSGGGAATGAGSATDAPDAIVAALDGVDAVIDVLGPRGAAAKDAVAFFERTTRTLQRAEEQAGVPHHVALSIVGAARTAIGYYAGKASQERLVAEGAVPWTILRTTQFYEFAEETAVPFGPWLISMKMRSQPLAAATVAARLVALAEAGPAGDAPDLAGPQEWMIAELLREILRARGTRRRVLELRVPGRFGRAIAHGAVLPGADAEIAGPTFEEWLAASHAA
ncbi:MAG: SDR family oxidoreductase [Leucobacter sp.]|nr:SDR family oxidoreductase [Leucobacter sp.]